MQRLSTQLSCHICAFLRNDSHFALAVTCKTLYNGLQRQAAWAPDYEFNLTQDFKLCVWRYLVASEFNPRSLLVGDGFTQMRQLVSFLTKRTRTAIEEVDITSGERPTHADIDLGWLALIPSLRTLATTVHHEQAATLAKLVRVQQLRLKGFPGQHFALPPFLTKLHAPLHCDHLPVVSKLRNLRFLLLKLRGNYQPFPDVQSADFRCPAALEELVVVCQDVNPRIYGLNLRVLIISTSTIPYTRLLLAHVAEHCPNVERLGISFVDALEDAALFEPLHRLSKLNTLAVSVHGPVSADKLSRWLHDVAAVRTLTSLSWYGRQHFGKTISLISSLSLRRLDISYNDWLSGACVTRLAAFPALQELSLRETPGVTSAAVLKLITNPAAQSRLRVVGLTVPDQALAVALARQGVELLKHPSSPHANAVAEEALLAFPHEFGSRECASAVFDRLG